MSNGSLKEQLQAVASQLTTTMTSEATQPSESQRMSVKKTHKTSRRWLEYVQYGVELLKVYFPATFKTGNEIKPLKKGIKHDLIMHLSTTKTIVTEDKACMVKSLAYYVNTLAYHQGVIEGAVRVDLEGHPAGIVSPEEAKYSIQRQQSKLQVKKSRLPKVSVISIE